MFIASVILFILPILLFPLLHILQDYYQAANSIFLVAAVAFLLSELIAVGKPVLTTILAVLLIAGSLARFYSHQWRVATKPLFDHFSYLAGKIVERATPPDSGLIVFGVGWSSEVNYYAKRKGLALPFWATPEETRMILSHPDSAMEDLKVAAVVDCRKVFAKYSPPVDSLIAEFMNTWTRQVPNSSGPAVPGTCGVFVKPRWMVGRAGLSELR
jgi:hypothetical protein